MSLPASRQVYTAGTHQVGVTTAGSAASATGTAYFYGARGVLARLSGNWHASAPGATSDVTIVETWAGGSRTLYTKSNAVTDFDFVPQVAAADNTGTAIAGAYGMIILNGGTITVTVSQSDALTDCLIVSLTTVE